MAKILIVDDSETLRLMLKDVLVSAGYDVIEGVDGRDGLQKATETLDLDLVITDFNMPQMDGVTMASKIREGDQHKDLPILMLTTEATPDLKMAGKKAGILAWIVKPLVPEKLVPAIQKVISRKA